MMRSRAPISRRWMAVSTVKHEERLRPRRSGGLAALVLLGGTGDAGSSVLAQRQAAG